MGRDELHCLNIVRREVCFPANIDEHGTQSWLQVQRIGLIRATIGFSQFLAPQVSFFFPLQNLAHPGAGNPGILRDSRNRFASSATF